MSDTMAYVYKTAFGQILSSLETILQKAADHAKSLEVEDSILLNHRFSPDMFPMVRQVQIATDLAIRGGDRLIGNEPSGTPDTETSFAELIARVKTAKEKALGYPDDKLNASEHEIVTFPVGDMTLEMPGRQFLVTFILANFYFHVSMAYALLRAQGVELSKRDYLMG